MIGGGIGIPEFCCGPVMQWFFSEITLAYLGGGLGDERIDRIYCEITGWST
jgi:hypothetical protein